MSTRRECPAACFAGAPPPPASEPKGVAAFVAAIDQKEKTNEEAAPADSADSAAPADSADSAAKFASWAQSTEQE